MVAFVSHSFDNKPEFDNVTDALTAAGVQYWNAEIKPGTSLRQELRRAVERCSVCVFVATRSSVTSSWCGAELGAFWGASKPIVVWLAEASLAESDLPQIVQGDVWERRTKHVADRVKELIAQTTVANGGGGEVAAAAVPRVGSMSVEQLEQLIASAVALGSAAATSGDRKATPEEIGFAAKSVAGRVLEGARATERVGNDDADAWRKRILWVDDRPENNTYERRALEPLGLEFTLALSTQEALDLLSKNRFAAIISDMGRKEGPREGYALLEALRASDPHTPFFIYAGSNAPAHKREALARGAQGSTNMAQELFDMVIRTLVDTTAASADEPPGSDFPRRA